MPSRNRVHRRRLPLTLNGKCIILIPAKRRAELQRIVRYTEGNPCYEYRRDAVWSLLSKGAMAPDLDGLPSVWSNDRRRK